MRLPHARPRGKPSPHLADEAGSAPEYRFCYHKNTPPNLFWTSLSIVCIALLEYN